MTRLLPLLLIALAAVPTLGACNSHEQPVRLVSTDGATEVVVETDGRVRLGPEVVGHLDMTHHTLTLLRSEWAGVPIDVYDGTKRGGSVAWRGPDYTLRDFGLTWSVVGNKQVKVNGALWGDVTGHIGTVPQRMRFVAAVSTLTRLVGPGPTPR